MSDFKQDLSKFQSVSQPGQVALPGEVSLPGGDISDFKKDLQTFKGDIAGLAEPAEIALQTEAMKLQVKLAKDAERERQQALRQMNAQDARTQVSEGDPTTGVQMSVEMHGDQGSILPSGVQVTQKFGNKNPGVEVFSGGINYGTDFGAKKGTPVAIPPGEWEVVDSWGGAKREGFIGNGDNSGYGNSVLIRNTDTGELMRYSHLDRGSVRAQAGQRLKGGTIFAKTGNTGNSTGPHLDLEYIDSKGRYQDVLNSPYAGAMFGASGGGNPLKSLWGFLKGDLNDQRAREIQEVGNRYGGMAQAGVMNTSGDLKEKTLTGAQLNDKEVARLNENAMIYPIARAKRSVDPIADRTVLLSAERTALNPKTPISEFMTADNSITRLAEKLVSKKDVAKLSKQFPVGQERITALVDLIEKNIK
jgi:murein DD-endopeptidase MepM/ murein hydrolase activator NlpD